MGGVVYIGRRERVIQVGGGSSRKVGVFQTQRAVQEDGRGSYICMWERVV